ALPSGEISTEFDPTIADVHTQPADTAGNDIGRILHVGTGYVRSMVVTVDGCDGVKAYAGLAMSYYETITEHWKRLSDSDWKPMVEDCLSASSCPAALQAVPWVTDFVAGVGSAGARQP